MTTLVSGFISNVNKKDGFSLQRYFELGKYLLMANIPKIIIVDKIMYDYIHSQNVNYDEKITYFINRELTDLYMYEKLSDINTSNVSTDNPNKDTKEYMLTICNKTEFMREAIKINKYNTDNFVWVDFGIKHIFGCSNEEYINKLDNLQKKQYQNIRIANVWNWRLDRRYKINIYSNVTWFFAGGVFGGHKDKLILFADLMKKEVETLINEHNALIWEVNLWYKIYLSNPKIFDPYKCDHNATIIDNY